MNVLEILNSIGYTDLRDCGQEYRTKPLYRHSDNPTSLCIKKHTGQWYDFGERVGGYLPQLIQKTLQLPDVKKVEEMLGENYYNIAKSHAVELVDVKKFDKELLVRLLKDHEYWINRGISKPTIETFEGGVASNGRMARRYVFPIFNDREELVGFSGRLLVDNPDFAKWKHIGAKTNWLYPLKWNADSILQSKVVILVESIGDMLALWDAGIKNVLVTFGVDISAKIIEFLLKIDVQKIIIAFNNDADNNLVGNNAAEDGRQKLLNYFDEQQVIVALPELKDFGTMKMEQIDLWRTTHLN